MPTTTPAVITPEIASFIKAISSSELVYVPVRDTMTPLECFANSAATAKTNGGTVVLGWTIWERAGAFAEAEHHAVVRLQDGSLIDVTPHEGESHILFVPDPSATYNGKVGRDNHRVALNDDPKVIEYIGLANKMNQGRRRVAMYGVDSLTNNQRNEAMGQAERFIKIQPYIDETYPGDPIYSKP